MKHTVLSILWAKAGFRPLLVLQLHSQWSRVACREEIAELCVALLTAPVATDVTFEIKSTVPFSQPFTVSNGAQRAKRDWAALLQAANVKPGVTGKTLNGAYTGREPERQKQRELVAAQLDQNDREGYT